MKNIREVFEENIKLLGYIDRAIPAFREGRYDFALAMIAESGDGINIVCDAIMQNREYFKAVSVESISEMLQNILDAKLNRDYVLLADLYELQLSNFIINIQELIMKREDFLDFDIAGYNRSITELEISLDRGMRALMGDHCDHDELTRLRVNRNAAIETPLIPEELVRLGYSVEFTSCGLMTMRAPLPTGEPIYLNTNANVVRENFMLAGSWLGQDIHTYIVYGLGLGYHVDELLRLSPGADVMVFESDLNVIKLFAAFGSTGILSQQRLMVVYDPDCTYIEERLANLAPDEKACVHYPSLRRAAAGPRLTLLAPSLRAIEEC